MWALVDIDGSVADLSHRLHYIKGEHKDYDKFFDECDKDWPIKHVVDIVEGLARQQYTIVFVSGRSDVCRAKTEAWLRENFLCNFSGPYMRKEGDTRADYIVKRELYEQVVEDMGEEPVMVVDDRPAVVEKCWRPLGLNVVRVGDWYEEERKEKCEPGHLHILCGPSGSGKTTLYHHDPTLSKCFYVSSDEMRHHVTGNWKDQTQNDLVFQACHAILREALAHGVDCVFDATNIRAKDRKRAAGLTKGPVTYVVIDRPMEEKEKTAGWRKDVPGLLERHTQTFKSNLKMILNGDGLENVSVDDRRDNVSPN